MGPIEVSKKSLDESRESLDAGFYMPGLDATLEAKIFKGNKVRGTNEETEDFHMCLAVFWHVLSKPMPDKVVRTNFRS